MTITNIKNNLHTVVHSTVDFTRSSKVAKVAKVAKFIFAASCDLLRCIRDNPKITLLSAAPVVLAGTMAQSPLLTIMGLALLLPSAAFMGIEKAASAGIDRLQNRINSLQNKIVCEQRGYEAELASRAPRLEALIEDLSSSQNLLESLVENNTAEIENISSGQVDLLQSKINSLQDHIRREQRVYNDLLARTTHSLENLTENLSSFRSLLESLIENNTAEIANTSSGQIGLVQRQLNRLHNSLKCVQEAGEDLSSFRSCLETLIENNTAEIENCQTEINSFQACRNW